MTSTTRDPLVCKECGHKGHLKLRENDSPYSSLWMEFSLEGFTGAEVTVTKFDYMPQDMLATLKPTCPACGRVGTVGYPERTHAESDKLVVRHLRHEQAARQTLVTKKPPAGKGGAGP